MLVAAGLAAATVLRAGGHELLLLSVGGAALVPLLLGLAVRWSPALALGVAILGGQQALRLALGSDELDTWAPASAGFLLLVAELAWWSIEPRVPAWSEPWLAPLRLVSVLAVCAAGAVLAGSRARRRQLEGRRRGRARARRRAGRDLRAGRRRLGGANARPVISSAWPRCYLPSATFGA